MLLQTASVCQAVVELVQELDSKLPEQHHLVADLLRIPSVTLEHASQTLINVWEVSHVREKGACWKGPADGLSQPHDPRFQA